ncbi:helix-turn-helix domain-containing protein [Cytobacillus massiliigabonensis]|uniref:helix-turn-helix domain-containing protein n=1 Tax=Cytobacillus massiliigabonensis TaxID=1871011 RepID=UPI000C821CA9|nr:helix-turn-helix domain-containing protein [Cytobacillus massiliigabonensis]
MIVLNAKALGEEIKRLRKTNNLSQAQLAEGICTQATISGIEAGRGYPSVDILYILSIRLKVSLDYFYKILLNDAQGYIQETERILEDLMKRKDYKETFEITANELKQSTRNLGYKFDQLIKWVYTISSYYLKKIDWQKAVTMLEDLLDSNHPLFGQDFIDFKIQNSLAIIYAENKMFQKSLQQYNTILSYHDFLKQHYLFQIKIHYNLAKLYFLQQDFKLSLIHAELGIQLSLENEDISMAGQLYYQQGISLEELGANPQKISDAFKTSLFIFQLLKRQEYVQMINKKKGEFVETEQKG